MEEKQATREAYGNALLELGEENHDVVVLDADLSKSTMTCKFASKYPERFFNMGIAEANMMAVASGLSSVGKIPFASTFAVFATGRAFDQIRQSIAYPKQNVKICATHAGLTVGADGASHQALVDVALMRALPNMSVISPADAVEARLAVKTAAYQRGPVYIRLGRHPVPVLFGQDYTFKIGKASVLINGDDVALVGTGIMTSVCLEAAEILKAEGVRPRVINMSTIKPIDADTLLEAANDCGCMVTAEEHNIIGGLGSAVCEVVCEYHPIPIKRIGINDAFGQSGNAGELLMQYGLTASHVAMAALDVFRRKR